MKLIITLLIFATLQSCGKAQGAPEDENECGYRFIAGKDCIVCSKGGVSCKW